MVTEHRCAVKSHCPQAAGLAVLLLGSGDLLCCSGAAGGRQFFIKEAHPALG